MTRFGLIYLFRVVWIDNCADAGRSRRLSQTALDPAGCTERKTIIIIIIIAIWTASVQPAPHSHTPASLLLLHVSRQRCPLCSVSRLSLLYGCLCWAMLYLLRCSPEVASALENLKRPPPVSVFQQHSSAFSKQTIRLLWKAPMTQGLSGQGT